MNYTIPELISYFGGLMGILLFIVTLFTNKKSNAIKYSLAAFLLVWSIVVIFGAVVYSGKVISFIHIFRLDSPLHYLMGPTVYLFTLSTLSPRFKYKRIYLLHLLPFLINVIEFLPFYLNTAEFKLSFYENLVAKGTVIMPIHYLLKNIQLTSLFCGATFPI